MRLVRYNPFNEITLFKNAFNDFFNDAAFGDKTAGTWAPAVDILDEDKHVVLSVELPGISKEDISVNIEDRVLTIKGERKLTNEDKKDNYYRMECRYGSFKRSFTLSDDILVDEVDAAFKDGILTVTLQKDMAKETVRQITIQ